MKAAPRPNAVKPHFKHVRTRSNRGFMTSGREPRARIVMLMMPV